MIQQKILRNNVQRILRSGLSSGLLSGLLANAVYLSGLGRSVFAFSISPLALFGVGFLFGFLIPLLVRTLFDIVLTHRRIKRLPYLAKSALRVLAIAAVMSIIYLLVGAVFFRPALLAQAPLAFTGLMTAVVAVAVIARSTVTEFLGPEFFRNIVTGRYHLAREQDVIILFVDLKGSTSFAESLPAAWFFQLLNEFLYIAEQSVQYHRGTVYKYLGDGLIAYWPAAAGNFTRARDVMRDITAELAEQREELTTKYWRPLECTAGLHCGPVLIGELGSIRKEIGLWGDTVNTAQRIQGACRQFSVALLCSREFYDRLAAEGTTPGVPPRTFEDVALRGKEKAVTLVALE